MLIYMAVVHSFSLGSYYFFTAVSQVRISLLTFCQRAQRRYENGEMSTAVSIHSFHKGTMKTTSNYHLRLLTFSDSGVLCILQFFF